MTFTNAVAHAMRESREDNQSALILFPGSLIFWPG
jgi:hypothetical protein